MTGPCMCGDPFCGSCGNPDLMRAIEGEIDRVNVAVGGFEGDVVCSCGRLIREGEDERHKIVDRLCMNCWSADHHEPDHAFDESF